MNIEPHPIRISSKLVASRAAELALELRDLLGDHSQVRCDLSEIEAIDPMGIQLLLAARATLRARGGSLTLESAPEPVRELCIALGLDLGNG